MMRDVEVSWEQIADMLAAEYIDTVNGEWGHDTLRADNPEAWPEALRAYQRLKDASLPTGKPSAD